MERIFIVRKLQRYFDNKIFVQIFILLCSGTAVSISYPFIYKYFIDHVLMMKKIENMKYVIGLMLVWLMLDFVIKKQTNKQKSIFVYSLINKIKYKLFKDILDWTLYNYLTVSENEVKRRIDNDTEELKDFLLIDVFNFFMHVVCVSILVFVMLMINPLLLFCCIGLFSISYFETKFIKNKVIRNSRRLREELAKEDHQRQDELNNYREIKCLNYENKLIANFEQRSRKIEELVIKEKTYQYVNKYLGALNHDLITRFFIYIVGGIIVIEGNMLTSSFLIFLGFYETAIKNIRNIIESNFSFSNRKSKLENILKSLESNEQYAGEEKYKNIKNIVFYNVNFKYSDDDLNKWILSQININFVEGHIYLLKGKSGIGKSTLLKLLYKEYENYQGNITINGVNYREIVGNEDFYRNFAIATADSKVFNLTIRENLLLANPLASEEELYAACECALLSNFLSEIEGGLDALVGENGSRLSGGQKERLVLARLFLSSASVFILDEALAEISATDEISIIRKLQKYKRESIIIVVSHRIRQLNLGEEVIEL